MDILHAVLLLSLGYYLLLLTTMLNRLSVLLCTSLFILSNLYTFAQRKPIAKGPPTFQDLIDTKKLIGKIPITRQDMHTRIAGQLKRIDNLDGKADGKISGFRGKEIDKEITVDILEKVNPLQNFIENVKWLPEERADNNIKLMYLKQLHDNLKLFGDVARTGNFEMSHYSKMIDGLKNILIAKYENKLTTYVQQNASIGLYRNKGILINDKEAEIALMNELCLLEPKFFENKLLEIAPYPNAGTVIAGLAKKDPLDVLKYATSTTELGTIIKNSKEPYVHAIYELGTQLKNSSRALNFLDKYVAGEISIKEINAIISNPETYYKKLVSLRQVDVANTPKLVTRDLKKAVADYVETINELHDKPAEVRFKSINNMNATDLYYLTIYGGDEIYTSSFLGVFNRIIKNLDKKSGFDYLSDIKMDEFRTFVRMCANYNTLDPFLATMPKLKQSELMHYFVSGLGDGNKVNLDGATEVADAFGSINDTELVSNLLGEIDMELQKAKSNNNKEARNVYYILKSLLSSKLANASETDFASLMNTDLKIPPINYVPFNSLIDTNKNTITEQMFFYGDADGKDWYNRFMSSMRASGKWIIEDKNPDWVLFKAKNSKVPFNLYANKPLEEPNDEFAQHRLAQYLVENDIVVSIVVHRGHSYHLINTIESIYELNKIVILGSCGGYHNLGTILDRSPDAHITSSKQVGKGNINSKIIDDVNNIIIKGEDVHWPQIWQRLNKIMPAGDRAEWNDYVFPHKNLGALFLKAYRQIGE